MPIQQQRVSSHRFRILTNAQDHVKIGDVAWTYDMQDEFGRTRTFPFRRWEYVRWAMYQAIMAMSPGARWLLLRDGFVHFQRAAGAAFRMLAPSPLSVEELRAVFDGIFEYGRKFEWHLWPGFELLHQKELRSPSSDVPTYSEELLAERMTDDNPEVEKIVDGSLRRVS